MSVKSLSTNLWGICAVSVALYGLYYWRRMYSPIMLTYQKNQFNQSIVSKCSLLLGSYWPSILVFNSHLQGIILMRFRSKVDPKYRRESIIAKDGATLLLDWGESEGPELTPNSPVVCLLTGTTGNSYSSYITYLMVALRKQGYRPVCMNYPGLTDFPMTAPRFFCIDSVSDLKLFIDHVHELYPDAPIIAIGFSIGGHFYLKYVQEEPDNPLSGLMTISAPFSPLKCDAFWKGKWINENVYDQHFLNKFKDGIRKTVDYINVDDIYASKNMYEMHHTFTIPLSKLKTIEEYYQQNQSDQRVKDVKVPTLILHAWNDPVIPSHAIPIEDIKNNPNLILATTERGGHTGWLSGFKPFSSLSWCENLAIEYVGAVVTSKNSTK